MASYAAELRAQGHRHSEEGTCRKGGALPSRILNVLSAQTESVSVTGFPGENFLSGRSVEHLALCLKASLTSGQSLEANPFLILCYCRTFPSSSAFRAFPALNS
jgi:hypothetical protein